MCQTQPVLGVHSVSGDAASSSSDIFRTQCLVSKSQSIHRSMAMLELTFLGSECVSPEDPYWLSLDCYRLLTRNPLSGINQKLAGVWVFFLSEDADLIDFIEIYLHCQNYLYPKPGKKLFEK